MQLTTEAFFRKPSQIISRNILQEASLAIYYWATDVRPDLTLGSVMKKWSSHARFFFQDMIRWCQNLLLLNYSYAFKRTFAPGSLIMLDNILAHTWFYSWARFVLSRAMILILLQWLHWRVRKEKKDKRFTAKLSRNVIAKKPRVPFVKVKIESEFSDCVICLTYWYGNNV